MASAGEHRFRALVRSILFWCIALVSAFWIGLAAVFLAILRQRSLVHGCGIVWSRLLIFVSGVRIEIEHRERLRYDRPMIVISNHQSLLDILVYMIVIETFFVWTAKASLFKIPIFGWGMTGAGYIPIDRGDKRNALKSLFDAADVIHNGRSLVIFPEGTRGHADGTMRPFKKGSFILARKAGVRLQPLTIQGANRILPKTGDWIQRVYPGTVRVFVHEPIEPGEYAGLSQEELMERMRAILAGPLTVSGA